MVKKDISDFRSGLNRLSVAFRVGLETAKDAVLLSSLLQSIHSNALEHILLNVMLRGASFSI